jgi:hypothetical protein
MGVYLKDQKDGSRGMLDVGIFFKDQGLIPTRVVQGNIEYKSIDGSEEGVFSIADWAIQNGYSVEKIDGFNTPVSALDVPPLGMNRLDQAVFFMAGKNVNELRELFPQAAQLDDGRVVVLDKDGLWKTMWSHNWEPPQGFPTYEENVAAGTALDTRVGMKAAGIAFLFGLTGVEAKIKNGDVTIDSVGKMLKVIERNAPLECQLVLSKLVTQTTGLDSWSFQTALINVDEVISWLKQVTKNNSFQFRMRQAEVAAALMSELHLLANMEFMKEIDRLEKLDITKRLVCNMKEVVDEFIILMTQMDALKDISRVSGLDDWKNAAEINEKNMPPMPAFVPRLHKLLQYIIPMSQTKSLAFVKGKRGLNAIASLMIIIDKCIFALGEVPDCSAKSKMNMALKTMQTKLENKLAFYYHPINDKTGLEPNEFMISKESYGPKREVVYKLVQTPKEQWAGMLLDNFRQEPNLEALYKGVPDRFRRITQSFIAMQIAWDMQSWVDSNYQTRANDPMQMFEDRLGPPPPEYGYLADNSPRAALNIIETLAAASAMMSNWPERQRREVLRSPMLIASLVDMIQAASIQREVGAVEALSKVGITHMGDPYRPVHPERIWEDPVKVQEDIDAQVAQVAAMMEAEAAAEEQARVAKEQEAAAAANAQMNQETGGAA